ncbi:hypothetical protein Efla_002434 [Eimeria flavescens]
MEFIGDMHTPTLGIGDSWTSAAPLRGSAHSRGEISSYPANPLFPEPPVTFHAVQYPEDRWVHPHRNGHQVGKFDFVTYYVQQRFLTSSYAKYEQSPSSGGERQPPSSQQQVQETIPNRLIRTRGLARTIWTAGCPSRQPPVSARRFCLPSSQIYFPLPRMTVNVRQIRVTVRGFVEGTPLVRARSPRSTSSRRVSSSSEQSPVAATESPRLQGCPSPGVSAYEGPASSAESSPQESAGDEPPAVPPGS